MEKWKLNHMKLQRASQEVILVKNPFANAGGIRDVGLIPGSGSSPGGGHATYSSILAWRISWTGEPDELELIGSQRGGHNKSDLASMHGASKYTPVEKESDPIRIPKE